MNVTRRRIIWWRYVDFYCSLECDVTLTSVCRCRSRRRSQRRNRELKTVYSTCVVIKLGPLFNLSVSLKSIFQKYHHFVETVSGCIFKSIQTVKWRHSNLWSPYDRHLVGITWYNVWSLGARIYDFIQMELNHLVRECHQLPNKMYLSDITVTDISRIILPTTWRQKPAGIDMERNCVIVTLYIA